MPHKLLTATLALLAATAGPALSAGKATTAKAGVARIDITPPGPIWMSGYASRTHPSEGVLQPLWAKALALEDTKGARAIIVTTDLIGLPRELTDAVAAEVMDKYQLDRSQIVFNSSHTHTGPTVRSNLSLIGPQQAEFKAVVDAYGQALKEKLATVIAAALGDLQPAVLAFDYGEAKFAANRRQFTPQGVRIGVNPDGPVDHKVPVLRVLAPNGKLRAVLFGYACHNTTLTDKSYQLSGDYAGFAQAAIENHFPGATALFMQLCGADQNPNPRGQLELAEQHGNTLAVEVVRILRTSMQPVTGRLRSVYQTADLPFAPHTREQFEREAQDQDVFKARRAQLILDAYDQRKEPRKLQYPVQVVRFEKGFTLVALGGEVVVDYSLWMQKTFPGERLMVAGYSNDVACYIPTARVLQEGGYEAVQSMVFYGQPGPFTEEAETRIQDSVTQAIRRVSK